LFRAPSTANVYASDSSANEALSTLGLAIVLAISEDDYSLAVLVQRPTFIDGLLFWELFAIQTAVFRVKLHFTWRKSATKFFCVNTVSDKL